MSVKELATNIIETIDLANATNGEIIAALGMTLTYVLKECPENEALCEANRFCKTLKIAIAQEYQ
jgi:hypothetical protein